MQAAVTGANGFVGTHLIAQLLEKGANVRAMVRSSKSRNELLSFVKEKVTPEILEHLEVFIGDVTNRLDLNSLFSEVDYVFHTAAIVSFNPRKKQKIHNINVIGTRSVVNQILEFKNKNIRLIHFSSIAAIGDSVGDLPANEDCWHKNLENSSDYSKSKYFAELEVWRGIEEGLNAVIINPAVIIGHSSTNRSSSALIRQMESGLPFVTGGSTGFVHVDDVCKAAIMLAESHIQSERFILCAENLSYKELFNRVQKQNDKTRKPIVINKAFLLGIALLTEVFSFVFNLEPKLTRRMVHSSFSDSEWDGGKIDMKYISNLENI
ncbi:MAG: NAD-dependent epimerase/dehydratase family protein [Salinivirgaceae bacterium]|nr:NAD-dependent epimerase/dehydratase family protein [Salinivirgaceae bacterium]